MDATEFNELLKKIKYDKNAVGEIYDAFYLKMKAHAKRRFGNLVSPEDVVQDIFEKLMKLETTEYVQYPATWLNKLVFNRVVDILRERHVEVELSDKQCANFDIEKTILEGDVRDAIFKLDKVSQQIVYLNYWEGYQLDEIAIMMNLSYCNTRAKASRAYFKLRKYLK